MVSPGHAGGHRRVRRGPLRPAAVRPRCGQARRGRRAAERGAARGPASGERRVAAGAVGGLLLHERRSRGAARDGAVAAGVAHRHRLSACSSACRSAPGWRSRASPGAARSGPRQHRHGHAAGGGRPVRSPSCSGAAARSASLRLLYTPTAIVIAQFVARRADRRRASPAAAMQQLNPRLRLQILALGATRWQLLWLLVARGAAAAARRGDGGLRRGDLRGRRVDDGRRQHHRPDARPHHGHRAGDQQGQLRPGAGARAAPARPVYVGQPDAHLAIQQRERPL